MVPTPKRLSWLPYISNLLLKVAHRNVWKYKLQSKFPANIVRNQKYNVFTFLAILFFEQFFNLYFLLVAPSQFVPALRTGAVSFLP